LGLQLAAINGDLQAATAGNEAFALQLEKLQAELESLKTANPALQPGRHDLQHDLYSSHGENVKTNSSMPEVNPDDPRATVKAFATWQIETDGRINQSEIARITSLSRPTVSKYVNGLAKVGR
jgi:hypothetical protein